MLRILGIILFWPFILLWMMAGLILKLTSKLILVGIGLAILIAGVVLCLTMVGLPLGIFLIIFGLVFTLKGLF